MFSITNSTLAPMEPLPYQNEYLLVEKVLSSLGIAIISFGLMANFINILVFLKVGVKDSVTILLLSLSMSDLIFPAFITPCMCGIFILNIMPSHRFPFDWGVLILFPYWPAYTAYDLSTFTAVSLGVVRCACVAMPLKFKSVFTKSRTVKWIMFLVILAVALRIPVLTVYRLAWRVDPASNTSEVYLKQVNRASMLRINDVINRNIVIFINYITMVVCVIILTCKLYQASKIRRFSTPKSPYDQSSSKTDDQGLSSKDLQVIKCVILVCTIFILSQLSFLVLSLMRLLVPEFTTRGNLVYLFSIFAQVNRTNSYINASLNIFVYYNFNSKFRITFKSLFFKGKQ